MISDTLNDNLAQCATSVVDFLDKYLAAAPLPGNLRDAIRYSLLGGGKRMRPALTLMSCDAVGGDRQSAIAPAAAMELIHCFSLVHDDLPAMDDDDMRRGRPTLHIHAGQAMAILAGDAMMSLAFQLISSDTHPLDPQRANAIASELARGTTAMIAGQVYDTLGGYDQALTPQQQLEIIHRNKTGALISAACRIGAIAGGATSQQLTALTTYGQAVGLMFQIVDDLLDVTQSSEHLGKAAGKDESAGKLTYPGVFGVERSWKEVQALELAANEALAPLGQAADGLRELCRYLAVRTK